MSDPNLDISVILEALPHRYPFLLIDRIVSFEPKTRLTGLKNVTVNEPFFQGHFPGIPVMPGVLILESLAQASGMLAYLSKQALTPDDPLYYLVKIDKARFRKPVVPGDQLILEVSQKMMRRGMGLYDCKALVDGQVVASAEILCAARAEVK